MPEKQSNLAMFPFILLMATFLTGHLATVPHTSADSATNPTSVDDNISITVDSSCTMSQTVLSNSATMNPGELSTIGSSRIAAYCNDSSGYDIYAIGYTNGEYGNTNMKSTDGNTIPTGTSGQDSYWNMTLSPGTAISSPSYIPTIVSPFSSPTTIPTDYAKVATYPSIAAPQGTDPLTSGSYFTSTYSSFVSTTQPAGVYTGAVQYVMVHPQGAPAPTFMQNTTAIKAILTNEGDTMQVIDKRDGKKYWIAKLADGNIWMTQNLDLNLSNNTKLTPANTDISSNWTPVNSTITFSGTTVDGWANSDIAPYSADPGELYLYSSNTTSNDYQYTSLEACQAAHPSCSMRNHIGNYYNWSAAVASNDTSGLTTQSSNAPDSICPAGWRLPTSKDRNDSAASHEWAMLLTSEGVMTDYTGNSYTTDGFNIIRAAPLWLARSGYVVSGTNGDMGSYGRYWTSTVYKNKIAYNMYFYSSYPAPTSNTTKPYGLSVRCVAR